MYSQIFSGEIAERIKARFDDNTENLVFETEKDKLAFILKYVK
jgi:hypothetical protein